MKAERPLSKVYEQVQRLGSMQVSGLVGGGMYSLYCKIY